MRGVFVKTALSVVLGLFLSFMLFGGTIGIYIVCAIVIALVVRGFLYIRDIHAHTVTRVDKVTAAVDAYEKEKTML